LKPIALRSGVDGNLSANQMNNTKDNSAFTVSQCCHRANEDPMIELFKEPKCFAGEKATLMIDFS
jgi:hypothetical protein